MMASFSASPPKRTVPPFLSYAKKKGTIYATACKIEIRDFYFEQLPCQAIVNNVLKKEY